MPGAPRSTSRRGWSCRLGGVAQCACPPVSHAVRSCVAIIVAFLLSRFGLAWIDLFDNTQFGLRSTYFALGRRCIALFNRCTYPRAALPCGNSIRLLNAGHGIGEVV